MSVGEPYNMVFLEVVRDVHDIMLKVGTLVVNADVTIILYKQIVRNQKIDMFIEELEE